jgi:hypothetical protein
VSREKKYDHVSVSFQYRAPKTSELAAVCKMIFDPSETVIEPSDDTSFLSIGPYCRHMLCLHGSEGR